MNHAARRLLASTAVITMALLGAACGDETGTVEATEGAPTPQDAASGSSETHERPGSADDDTAGDQTDGAAVGEGLTAASPVYPLEWVAGQVAPGADVTLLSDQGEDPHDMELSPRDRELIETADLVLYMGDLDYQPHVESAIGSASGRIVSFADAVGGDTLLTWDDHSDDHEHDRDNGSYDPHAWFDPGGMAVMAREVGEAFAGIDPDDAASYRDNADTLYDELMDLDQAIDGMLSGACAHDYVVVSHEAYAYLLEPYGHGQEGVSGADGHGPASPQRIAELADRIAEDGIRYVLTEPVEGRDDAEGVAGEAGVELLEIYSLEVVDDADHFEALGFAELLREQAQTAATALGCE